ncbi:hypothetical protein RI129_003162 [Pyrocoelia pectoralis]|uniref:Mutator-like transposase domain-containing protein n=1 Tax=Pyrocoelia pectoralis TaxID=417401 RepID=A0AAN7VHR3_9COLE
MRVSVNIHFSPVYNEVGGDLGPQRNYKSETPRIDERTLAIENNHVDCDGMPWITVYLDGGWSKRSYGHNYDAASGVGVIIGKRTGRILYMGVRNKFCVICTKSTFRAARKLFSVEIIKNLQKYAEKAMYDNAHGDIGSLINDLNNGLSHVFMDHLLCKDYNCTSVGDSSKSRLPDAKSSGLYRHIHAASLIDNETNNHAELFMSILARFINMGKRLNLIQKGSFQNRTNLTSLRYCFEWHYSPWKKATKRSPGKYFKLYITRKQSATLKTGAYTRQRKTQPKARVCLDYGPAAQQPPLHEDQVAEECERTLRQLEVNSMVYTFRKGGEKSDSKRNNLAI